MAVSVYSVTRSEINEFWRRKEMEEEDQRLAAEKEAARIKARTLEMEDYMLFEQMIRELLEENEGDRARRMERNITKNSRMVAAGANNTEARVGIKHWWKRSAYAYLNEPALTSMGENDERKHTMTPHIFDKKDVWNSPYQLHPKQTTVAL